MIKDIVFLSISKMKKVRPTRDTIVVSILDSSEARERPRLAGFRGALTLEFEDVAEEHKGHEPGSWPAEPTDVDHAQFAHNRGERIPALADAERIVRFLQHHHASEESVKLIVHCHGGISRSAAVAHWASVRFWVPVSMQEDQSLDRANPRLMRLLNQAAGIR